MPSCGEGVGTRTPPAPHPTTASHGRAGRGPAKSRHRLQHGLAEIGTGLPSWTVFYHRAELPVVRRVALRPLDGLAVRVSLAAPPGVPSPQVRALLRACARVVAP